MSDKDAIYRQDAIKTIKDADVFVAYHEKDPIDEAVDEAIRATKRSVIYDIGILPSASTELSNDSPKLDNKNGELISRQDAIKYFAELWECIGTISDREEWEDVCVTTVNEIKSAEPRKKGKWIDTGSGQECSVCGEIQYGYDNYRRFCANCGADMREGEQK